MSWCVCVTVQCQGIVTGRNQCRIHLFTLLSSSRTDPRCHRLHHPDRYVSSIFITPVEALGHGTIQIRLIEPHVKLPRHPPVSAELQSWGLRPRSWSLDSPVSDQPRSFLVLVLYFSSWFGLGRCDKK